ncbi:MAG: hypothetical protein K2O38_03140 [Muribaculaceae bacterium]|nr:hypothetical protein [Muribaculaceae bacterium]
MKTRYNISKPEVEWDGLTLDELRYARALTQARIDISREMLATRANAIFHGRSNGTGGKTMVGRMLGALNWLDYGLIAVRVGSKLTGIFRRRK